MAINPVTLLIVGAITGISGAVGGTVTYAAFHYAEKATFEGLTAEDLLPMPPPHPPLPRFMYTKPELLKDLRKD